MFFGLSLSCSTVAFCLLTIISANAQNAPLFPQQAAYASATTNAGPITFHDMNGDGKPDEIYVGGYSGSVSAIYIVLQGGATSTLPLLYGQYVGQDVTGNQFQFADLNHDGKQDVVFAIETSTGYAISVAYGNGDGTLQAPVSYVMPGYVPAFSLADMNGDGVLDLVALIGLSSTQYEVAIGLTGSNGIGPLRTYPVPDYVSMLVTGDFNGDGKTDVATSGVGLNYWMGNGDGTLGPRKYQPEAGHQGCLAAGDLNGDGMTDIVSCTTSGAGLVLLLGNASGALSVNAAVQGPTYNSEIRLADLTGQGVLDVIAGRNTAGPIFTYLNDGKANLTLASTSDSFSGIYLNLLQVVDLNGTGKPGIITEALGPSDLVVPYFAAGNGDGTFEILQATPTVVADNPLNSKFAAGDFNGDGLMDFVTVSPSSQGSLMNQLEVSISRGDGSFAAVNGPLVPYGYPLAADLNKDGKMDVAVVTFYENSLQITPCLGNGNGTFHCLPTQTMLSYTIASGLEVMRQGVALADINGDGIPDILYEDDSSGPSVFYLAKGNGDGTFAKPTLTNITFPNAYASGEGLLVTDLNRDGHPDVIIAKAGGGPGNPMVFLGSASGSFTESAGDSGLSGFPVAVADLDGDGIPDLVTTVSQQISIYSGIGDGTFDATPVTLTLPGQILIDPFGSETNQISVVGIGDVNGDGLPDIVALVEPYSPALNVLQPILNQGGDNYLLDSNTYPVSTVEMIAPQVFLGKLNRSATQTAGKASLDAAVFTTNAMVSLLNQRNPAPGKAASAVIKLAASLNPLAIGQAETFTATVEHVGGASPTGSVTFYYGTQALATENLVNGTASLTASTTGLPEGIYPIAASYSGDTNYRSAMSETLDVDLKNGGNSPTQTFISVPFSTAVQTMPAEIDVTVVPGSGIGVPTGTVTITAVPDIGGAVVSLGTVPLSNGAASLHLTVPGNLAPGYYDLTAKYNGSSAFASSSNPVPAFVQVEGLPIVTITQYPATAAEGSSQTFVVTVTDQEHNPVSVGGSMYLYIGTQEVSDESFSGGTATFNVSIPSYLGTGTFAVTAKYYGYFYVTTTSPPVSITVTR